MGHQHIQDQDTSLVLSSDAKPRLKWTPELHQRFVDAVAQLRGADKATPKTLMRVMGIPGLTLYHLKSHLQKFRLGKSQQSEISNDIKQQEFKVKNQRRGDHFHGEVGDETQNQIDDRSLHIAQALRMQMDVQRKLHEQIEVQRHLQLRIEAQGKYLQSVLKKAQETLSEYNSSPPSVGVEIAKAELSQLVSMVDNGCPSSSLSALTDNRGLTFKDNRGSLESSLTSSDQSSGQKEKNQSKHEREDINNGGGGDNCFVLSLGNQVDGRKRRKFEFFDLNRQFLTHEFDSGPEEAIDSNSTAMFSGLRN